MRSKSTKEYNEKTIVAFDVDLTLIHEDGTPIYENIEIFDIFKNLGCTMIIWSGGGVEYAQRWAEKLGLKADNFPIKGSMTPDIVFDDMDYTWKGKVSIKV